jgi:NTE family protein
MDLTGEALTRAARRIFVEIGNPTSDYNLFPLVSLIKGRRSRRITEQAILDVAGPDIGLEDSWTTYFCVAGNYSTATEAVLRAWLVLESPACELCPSGSATAYHHRWTFVRRWRDCKQQAR